MWLSGGRVNCSLHLNTFTRCYARKSHWGQPKYFWATSRKILWSTELAHPRASELRDYQAPQSDHSGEAEDHQPEVHRLLSPTFLIDACKSTGIAEETRMKFVGHQLEGVHGIYGNPYVLPHESELIDTVRFDGIDFSCYAES